MEKNGWAPAGPIQPGPTQPGPSSVPSSLAPARPDQAPARRGPPIFFPPYFLPENDTVPLFWLFLSSVLLGKNIGWPGPVQPCLVPPCLWAFLFGPGPAQPDLSPAEHGPETQFFFLRTSACHSVPQEGGLMTHRHIYIYIYTLWNHLGNLHICSLTPTRSKRRRATLAQGSCGLAARRMDYTIEDSSLMVCIAGPSINGTCTLYCQHLLIYLPDIVRDFRFSPYGTAVIDRGSQVLRICRRNITKLTNMRLDIGSE